MDLYFGLNLHFGNVIAGKGSENSRSFGRANVPTIITFFNYINCITFFELHLVIVLRFVVEHRLVPAKIGTRLSDLSCENCAECLLYGVVSG